MLAAMVVHYLKWSSSTVLLLGIMTISFAFDYEIIKVEDEIKADKIWNVKKIKVKKLRPGVYGIDGQAELLQPLGNSTKVTVKVGYNPNGAGKYMLLPFNIGAKSACDYLNNDYKKYLSNLPEVSNFPQVGDDYYCPLQKGTYRVNTYKVETTNLPDIFKPGYYKTQAYFEASNGDLSIISFFTKVIRTSLNNSISNLQQSLQYLH
ncbi:uncharacterized protein LOC119649787 isoform X2 [Hermetia illucens]|uniref:uncharacterized protein LOC119649787 isoform X2 n=1 Tax=Hermetia illucens TaxID=343691 RepID=UPI0018CBF647|nr:uncharacterized protein LOC119649787 isoform X2 [Hermetia illucens]